MTRDGPFAGRHDRDDDLRRPGPARLPAGHGASPGASSPTRPRSATSSSGSRTGWTPAGPRLRVTYAARGGRPRRPGARGRPDDHGRLPADHGGPDRAGRAAQRRRLPGALAAPGLTGVTASRFGAPEQSPGFLLWRVTLSWQRQMRAALAPHDLTHVQFVLLASLWWLQEHGTAPPTQAQLAEQAGTDLMMTSQVIRRLEGRGLVSRDRDPADSRAWRLALTAAGRERAGRRAGRRGGGRPGLLRGPGRGRGRVPPGPGRPGRRDALSSRPGLSRERRPGRWPGRRRRSSRRPASRSGSARSG